LVSTTRVTAGGSTRRAASALVALEVAVAVVLLIGAGLILRSSSRLLAVDPGFRIDGVLTMGIRIPADRYATDEAQRAWFDRAMTAVRGVPGIVEAGAAVVTPLTGNNWTIGMERAEHPVPAGERPPEVGWQNASGGYFRAMAIPLLSGRLFDERDGPKSKPVVIISEAIERRYFPNERAVGHEVKLGSTRLEVVGVVGNIRRAGLRDEPRADMYFPIERGPGNQTTLFVRTASEPARVAKSIEAALKGVEPGLVVLDRATMAEVARDSIQVVQLVMWLLGVFAAVALALAAVGIYGVMSYVVRQRTREIGTRVALGATTRDIVWLVMKQGGAIALAGTAIGLGAGLVAARSLGTILYGVSATDPMTLAIAAGALVLVTMTACYLPARRASLIDPARTLAEQ
jgi:putative ABC transport system permease protein